MATESATNSEFRYMGHAMPYLPREGCTGKLIVIEGTDGCGRSTQAVRRPGWSFRRINDLPRHARFLDVVFSTSR